MAATILLFPENAAIILGIPGFSGKIFLRGSLPLKYFTNADTQVG